MNSKFNNLRKKKLILIIIFIISVIIGEKILVSATVSVPEGSPITDANLYKCVLDEYNKEFGEQYDYNHIFTDEELRRIKK